MNYIVPCLGSPNLAFCAATAFATICDTCRGSLVDDLDSLMHVYGNTAAAKIEVSTLSKATRGRTMINERMLFFLANCDA
jgi:ubiquinone biosynthesis protein Coq4